VSEGEAVFGVPAFAALFTKASETRKATAGRQGSVEAGMREDETRG